MSLTVSIGGWLSLTFSPSSIEFLCIRRDSEGHVATLWEQRDSERKQAILEESERHAEILWHWERL